MNSRSSAATLAVVILVVTSLVLAAVPVVTDGHDTLRTTTVLGGEGGHGPRTVHLQATLDDFKSAGYVDGDQVMLKFQGQEPIYGLYCTNKDSAGYFEVYISPDRDSETMTIGQKFGSLGDSYTGSVQISFVKHLDRSDSLTHYLSGKVTRSESPSDEAFCNHHSVTAGDIKPGMLYRSVDPLGSNRDERAAVADRLAEEDGIAHEINLCESASSIEKRIKDGSLASTYCRGLYENGDVLFEPMSPLLFNNTEQFKVCLEYMIDNDGPFLIHCMEGKDRTGMFFILLEGLCGATMEEVAEDYMQTMVNFYNIVPGSQEYDTVKGMMFDRIVYFIAHPDQFQNCFTVNWDSVSISGVDINKVCTDYILDEVGMTQGQLDALVQKLTN